HHSKSSFTFVPPPLLCCREHSALRLPESAVVSSPEHFAKLHELAAKRRWWSSREAPKEWRSASSPDAPRAVPMRIRFICSLVVRHPLGTTKAMSFGRILWRPNLKLMCRMERAQKNVNLPPSAHVTTIRGCTNLRDICKCRHL
ncbi:unnamed protein product, partial [Urochloa humidicola]